MKYKRVPRRVRFLADFRMTDSQWDGLMMPDQHGVLLQEHAAGAGGGAISQPGGRYRIAAVRWMHGTRLSRRIRCSQEMEPDVEALLVNRIGLFARVHRPRILRGPHRRMLQTGRIDPQALARAVGRRRSLAGDRRSSSRAEERSGSPRGGDSMPDLASRSRRRTAVPFAASPTLAFRLRVANAIPARRSTPWCCAARSRSKSRGGATRAEIRNAAARPFRRAGAMGPDAAQHAVDATPARLSRSSPAVTVPSICRCPARSISTSRRRSISMA